MVAAYDRRGRIRGDHREAAYDRAAGAWLADHLQGRDAILLAGSNEEAAELARRVQAQLVRMGTVVQPRAPLADGNQAGTGDLIRARLNTRIDAAGQRLTNRDVLRIQGWQGQAAEVTRRLPGGGWSASFLVPLSYLASDAELHYAGNIHVAQGRTIDTSHVLVTDTLNRRAFYVGMSRGRQSNIAHVVTGETAPPGTRALPAGDRRGGHSPGHGTGFCGAVGDRADPGQPGMGVRDRARPQPVGRGDAPGAHSRD